MATGGGQTDAAAFGDDDPVCACRFGGTDDGAEVVWVFDVVTDDNKGRLVAGFLEDVLHGGKIMAGSHGDNALVDHSFAKGVQLLCCRILDGNARLFGKGDDFAHAAAVGSFEDIDAVDRATFFQRFGNGVASCDDRAFTGLVFRYSFSGHVQYLRKICQIWFGEWCAAGQQTGSDSVVFIIAYFGRICIVKGKSLGKKFYRCP